MTDAQFVAKAFGFAAQAHVRDRRPGWEANPYINHSARVAEIIAENEGTTDMIAAAILHGIPEVKGGASRELGLKAIRKEFGVAVSFLVDEISIDKTLTEKERRAVELTNAENLSIGAMRLTVADKTAMLEEVLTARPKGWTEKNAKNYFVWAKKVVDKCRGHDPSLEKHFDKVYELGAITYKIKAPVKPA